MKLFKRQSDATNYGSSERRQDFYHRNGVKPGESSDSYVKAKDKEFEKRERKLAKKASRRNRGSLF